MNHTVKVPPELYNSISDILSRGIIEKDGTVLDFSPVQDIHIENGMATFSPPASLSVRIGLINIKTTIPYVKVINDGIQMEVSNSPINIKVIPE
jgi:hypothetical protein